MAIVTRQKQRHDLPLGPRIRYTRKSTEEDTKQIASHDQQDGAMDAKWGPTNTGIVFRDNFTGTTFTRPGFQEMLQFCESNKQDKRTEKGFIEVYDMTRFGRILANGEEDPEAMLVMLKHFFRLGWEVRFTTIQSTGNKAMDFFQNGLYAIMAGEYSKKLSKDVRRGRHHFLNIEGGARWMGGYNPPFGTQRTDPETGKVLARKERAMTRGGTILVPVPHEIEMWTEAARKIVYGKETLTNVARWLTTNDARRECGARWDHRSLKLVLTNAALIGELHQAHRDPSTDQITTKIYKAAWDPMVDLELFRAVGAELAARAAAEKRGPRSTMAKGILTPRCAHCGVAYHASTTMRTWRRKDGSTARKRIYSYEHPLAPLASDTEWAERIREAGCKHWRVPADTVDTVVKDLVLQRRTSEEFSDDLMALMDQRGDLEESATKQREEAERKLRTLQREQVQVAANMSRAQGMGLDDAVFWDQLADLNKRIEEVRKAKDAAIELEQIANSAWDSVRDLIDETRNLASIWEHGTAEEQRQVLSWWVRDLLIVANQDPNKVHSSSKHLVVFLRTAPTEGIDSLLTGDQSYVGVSGTMGSHSTAKYNVAYVTRIPTHYKLRRRWAREYRWHPADSLDVAGMLGGEPVSRVRTYLSVRKVSAD